MSPRRRSGAARRAKKLAEETNTEQPTPSREVSTQQGTTVCEDEEAAPFGAEKEETEIGATSHEPQEGEAQVEKTETEKQKPPKEKRRRASREENSEMTEESEASADDEKDSKDEDKDSADEEDDLHSVEEGEEDTEEDKEKLEKKVKTEEETENLHGPAGAVPEEEQESKGAEVISREKTGDGDEADEPTKEAPNSKDERMEDNEAKEQVEKEEQEPEERQLDEERDGKQPEDAKPEADEEGGREPEVTAEELEEEEEDNDATVAEERHEEPRADRSGSFAEWAGSDTEFSVAPSVESTGACCITDIAGSVCEELFIARDGFYGPHARSRVFSEAKDVVIHRIPSALNRYAEEAQNESIGSACLSCTSDASDGCFPTAKLFMDVLVASGAAVMSVLYQYRNEILKSAACLANSTFKCLRTCICTVTPPPQEPRAVARLPPGPWVAVGDSTEMWAPMDSGEMTGMRRMQSAQQRLSLYPDAQSPSNSPRQSIDALQRQAAPHVSQRLSPQALQSQGSQGMQAQYRPIIAPGTNKVVFSRRVTVNN